jgi:hypothetical protein
LTKAVGKCSNKRALRNLNFLCSTPVRPWAWGCVRFMTCHLSRVGPRSHCAPRSLCQLPCLLSPWAERPFLISSQNQILWTQQSDYPIHLIDSYPIALEIISCHRLEEWWTSYLIFLFFFPIIVVTDLFHLSQSLSLLVVCGGFLLLFLLLIFLLPSH